MSAVIYARVPDEINEGVDKYAADMGLTKARAVSELLDIALGNTPRHTVYQRLSAIEERLQSLEESR